MSTSCLLREDFGQGRHTTKGVMEPHGHGLAMGHDSAVPYHCPSRPSGPFGHRIFGGFEQVYNPRIFEGRSIQRAHHPEPQRWITYHSCRRAGNLEPIARPRNSPSGQTRDSRGGRNLEHDTLPVVDWQKQHARAHLPHRSRMVV